MKAVFTAQAVHEALYRSEMDGGFYKDPKSLALVEQAVRIGVVIRLSVTQAQWNNAEAFEECSKWITDYVESNNGEYPLVGYEAPTDVNIYYEVYTKNCSESIPSIVVNSLDEVAKVKKNSTYHAKGHVYKKVLVSKRIE